MPHHEAETDATVREWTDILGRIRFGSLPHEGRRKRSALAINAVAQRLATYADPDGSRVFPGLARLAATLEIEYETAKDCLAVLRALGLIRLVRAGNGPGRNDEYQLTIPTTLLDHDHLEVLSPRQLDAAVERISAAKRGRYRTPHMARKQALRGPTHPADAPPDPTPAGSSTPRSTPDGPDLRGPTHPADDQRPDPPAGSSTPPGSRPAGSFTPHLQGPTHPATHHVPLHVHPPSDGQAVRTAATGPGASDPEPAGAVAVLTRPDPPPVQPTVAAAAGTPAPRCGHGLAAGCRPDGQPACVLCRRGLPAGRTGPHQVDPADDARRWVPQQRRARPDALRLLTRDQPEGRRRHLTPVPPLRRPA